MPRFSTHGPVEVRFDVGVAHVVIDAVDEPDALDGAGEVEVEITPTDPGRDADVDLALDSRAELDGNRLSIHVPRRTRWFGRTESVEVHIRVPAGSAVDGVSHFGDVRARGVLGRTDLRVTYGQTRLERTGDLTLSTPHGEVEIAEVDGVLELRSGHGTTRVGRVGGAVDLTGTHGNVEFGTTEGPVRASLAGGLQIRRALAPVEVTSNYGVVRIGELLADRAGLRTSYEAIEVGIPEGVAAWMDANSQHGTVRTDLPSRGAPAAGERHVELHLRSGHGNILVHRATSPL